jgi:nitrite reductase/ring-hydroxylating ferredoxin subunit
MTVIEALSEDASMRMDQARSVHATAPAGTHGSLLAGLATTAAPLDRARTLPREVYTSPDILALEQRELFRRMWLCIGREEDFPKPGSFLTQTIANERILVIRGEDGALRAFFNVCRHRGSHLVEEPCGQIRKAIACPYHAWTYGFDGKLLRTPRPEPGFRTEDFPVNPVQLGHLVRLRVHQSRRERDAARAVALRPAESRALSARPTCAAHTASTTRSTRTGRSSPRTTASAITARPCTRSCTGSATC